MKKYLNDFDSYLRKNQISFILIQTFLLVMLLLSKSSLLEKYINVQRVTLLIWPIVIYLLKLKKEVSFFLALSIILVVPLIMMIDHFDLRAERFGDYAYGFIIIGTFQWLIEILKAEKKNES